MTPLLLALALVLLDEDPARPPDGADRLQTDEGWATLSRDDLKKMKANNIFSPPKPPKKEEPKKEQPKKEEPKKEEPKPPKMVAVTGFYYDEQDKAFKAVVEGLEGVPYRIFKAGEEVAGGKILEIRLDSLVHVVGETTRTLRVGDRIAVDGSSVTSGGSAAPAPAPSVEPANLDANELEKKRREMMEKFRKKPVEEDAPDEESGRKKRRGD